MGPFCLGPLQANVELTNPPRWHTMGVLRRSGAARCRMSSGLRQASPSLPTLDEVRAAAEIVYGLMQPTPQYRWPLLCSRLATEVWVKHENHTPIAAFKARTALVYTEKLLQREPGIRGLIAATRGNHGQSVALAAQRKNLECLIVVPQGNS